MRVGNGGNVALRAPWRGWGQREIEREENERRKPLTDVKRSKRLVRRAEETAPILAERRAELRAESAQKSPSRGRPPADAPSRREVTQALGVRETTFREAEAHVEAVEEFPDTRRHL